jgi:predicted nucleotidyltransferase component of viral defense system
VSVSASVHARLVSHARATGDVALDVMVRYANERLLYRLAQSAGGQDFVLKGATLFTVWFGRPHRATRDIDLLGRGQPDVLAMVERFRALCTTEVEDDGLAFDPESVVGTPIREDAVYLGVRVRLVAHLGRARLPVQVDIGLGDAVYPLPETATLPTLLPFPAPTLRCYRPETAIAEKLEAMVVLDLANSRMKDFYDIRLLAQRFTFGPELGRAIRATFARRATPLPETLPVALTERFALDATKQTQWNAWVRKSRAPGAASLPEVVADLAAFLGPHLEAARASEP